MSRELISTSYEACPPKNLATNTKDNIMVLYLVVYNITDTRCTVQHTGSWLVVCMLQQIYQVALSMVIRCASQRNRALFWSLVQIKKYCSVTSVDPIVPFIPFCKLQTNKYCSVTGVDPIIPFILFCKQYRKSQRTSTEYHPAMWCLPSGKKYHPAMLGQGCEL